MENRSELEKSSEGLATDFQNRMSRSDYQRSMFIAFPCYVFLGVLLKIAPDAFRIIILVAVLLLNIASIMWSVRRLHDINLSGWWALLLWLPVINIGPLCYLLIAKGTAGDNRFGPDPLAGK